MKPKDRAFILYMIVMGLLMSLMCGCTWQIHYDRAKVRECERQKARIQERLEACENPPPPPKWSDWSREG